MKNSLMKQMAVLFCVFSVVFCSCNEKAAKSKTIKTDRPTPLKLEPALESTMATSVSDSKQPESPSARQDKDVDKADESKRPVRPKVKPAVTDGSTATRDRNRATQPKVNVPVNPNIVAIVGGYAVTKQEFEERLLTEISPRGYDSFGRETERPSNEAVLMKMVTEKAMILEAREQGYLEKDETLIKSVKRYRERRIANLLLQRQLQDKINKITITDAEVEEIIKANPKLTRDRAEAMVKRIKANEIIDQYFAQVSQKLHVTKVSENFNKAVQIHQRLLNNPKKPRKVPFIRNYQIKEELTEEEKKIVLAKYDNGQVTLLDWFNALGEIAPPSRPKNLNTVAGVEQLLNRALRLPLLVTEAGLLGLDKNMSLLKQVKEYEDRMLLSRIRSDKYKELKEPTTEEIVKHFNENKEAFRAGRFIKADQIRCQDLETARKARAALDSGEDFQSVREKYALNKKDKASNTYLSNEGIFWEDLWKADPNEIVGPIKCFYRNEVKWRVAKILEKQPGELKEYSSDLDRRIRDKMMTERREVLLEQYGKELLKKYPHQIYTERIKGIDPLDIP
jgi:hypothetical protein